MKSVKAKEQFWETLEITIFGFAERGLPCCCFEPRQKKKPIYGWFKQGVTNILVTTAIEVLKKHVMLSFDNKYHFSGVG